MRHSADHRFDVKTIHGGGKHYASARARGGDGQCGAVADRARIVQTDYERHAERLDGLTEVRHFNGGRIDAVRVRLQQLACLGLSVPWCGGHTQRHRTTCISWQMLLQARWRGGSGGCAALARRQRRVATT